MKRNRFLQFIAATASAALLPVKNFAGQFGLFRDDKGFKVDAGKDRTGRPLSVMEGDTFYTKLSGGDTNNDLYVFESTRVKEGGPSYHIHPEQDEWWYIMSGTFRFKVGGNEFDAKPGDFVFGPRGVPHAFAKVGEGAAKLFMGFQPAGKMEAFFEIASKGTLKNLPEEEREAIKKAHGFYTVGPAIGHYKI
jgi:mannose-6-phosphate isomerase-like protein (cupin superfamily)